MHTRWVEQFHTRPVHARWRGPLTLLAAVTAIAVAVLVVNVSVAGAVTFQDHWQGNVVVNFKQGSTVDPNLQKLAPIPGVGQTVEKAWSKATRKKVCHTLEAHVAAETSQSIHVERWHCSLPASGDLQAALVGPNELGLQFRLSGIAVRFGDPSFAGIPALAVGIGIPGLLVGGDPTLTGTADADVQLTVAFPDSFSASVTPTVSIVSSEATFSNAHLSTGNVFVNLSGEIPKTEAEVDSYVLPNVASLIGLQPDVTQIEGDLRTGASLLWAKDVVSRFPEANQLFNLRIGVGKSTLIVTYQRGVPEPVPTGCSFYGSAGVEAVCSPHQPHGLTTLLLQDLMHGQWTDNTREDRSLDPGDPAGPEWATLAGAPYPGWQPNDGPDTDDSPLLFDYPNVPKNGATVEARVCSSNEWGLNCTTDAAVAGVLPGDTGQNAGGGGGGGSGEGPSAGPRPTPPGTQRKCGDPGVFCHA